MLGSALLHVVIHSHYVHGLPALRVFDYCTMQFF